MFCSRDLVDGAEIEFDVDGHKGTLFIDVPGRLTFDHSLYVEGCPIVARAEAEPSLLSFQMQPASEESGNSASNSMM